MFGLVTLNDCLRKHLPALLYLSHKYPGISLSFHFVYFYEKKLPSFQIFGDLKRLIKISLCSLFDKFTKKYTALLILFWINNIKQARTQKFSEGGAQNFSNQFIRISNVLIFWSCLHHWWWHVFNLDRAVARCSRWGGGVKKFFETFKNFWKFVTNFWKLLRIFGCFWIVFENF